MERRLAAIFAADVVSYSRLMAADEEGTLGRLKSLREDLIERKLAKHHGRIFKTMGDGFLAEFSSTVGAVRCAVELQQVLREQNAPHSDDQRLVLRIGVNVGDVILEKGDFYGDGVNIAARLEQIAEPGGISISSAVYQQVRGKIEQVFDDFGHHKLKNIDNSVHVYQARQPDTAARKLTRALFDFGEDLAPQTRITGGCLCGATRYELNQPPVGSGFCHCRFCQLFSGAPMSVWTAFPAGALRFVSGGPQWFASSPIAERGFCRHCGTSLTYRLLKPEFSGFDVVFGVTLDEPGEITPTSHAGIESQMPWLDIHDDLPRSRCSDSPKLQRAWESVGVTDPSKWQPGS